MRCCGAFGGIEHLPATIGFHRGEMRLVLLLTAALTWFGGPAFGFVQEFRIVAYS